MHTCVVQMFIRLSLISKGNTFYTSIINGESEIDWGDFKPIIILNILYSICILIIYVSLYMVKNHN